MYWLTYFIIFFAGMYCGHAVSPWVDGKLADWERNLDADLNRGDD